VVTKKEPLRTCIGCGEGKPKKELLRIVKTPEGEIMLDPCGRKNGRGAYICRNAACMEKAAKTRGLDRSFRENVPQEVYARLAAEVKALAGETDTETKEEKTGGGKNVTA
jgi:predicted RNA-binding protein YlxR (DUF448 family)